MGSRNNPGRVAGLWYVLLVLLGPLRLIYIPGRLFVKADASATMNNIAAHELLFRWGIVSDLAVAVVLIFLVLAFYRLFESVSRKLAVLVVIFGGVLPAAIDFVTAVWDLSVLAIVKDASLLAAFSVQQREAIAMLLLNFGDQQNTAAEILWGVWLLPLAVLVYRSGFLPRFLGVWLGINGVAYLALSLTGVLWPSMQHQVFLVSQPAMFGEIALTLWLVIRGAKVGGPERVEVSVKEGTGDQ
jgi:hypothetical protein